MAKIENKTGKIDLEEEIVKYINSKKEIKEPVFRIFYQPGRNIICNPRFINDGERIRTSANEVPNGNDGWKYNGSSTYDYIYCIIDNKVLVIEEERDLEDGDIWKIALKLYPNADTYTIKTTKGHRDRPFIQFVDENEKTINKFWFDLPRDDFTPFNGIKLVDYIKPITTEEIQERYKPKTLYR